MNKLIKTTPVDGTVITKDNCREGIDMIWHIQNIEKMIDSSCEYMKFKKIVDAEIILMFPVSEIDIIRHIIIKHVFNGENMTYKKIADDILDKLYKGEISYLSINDRDACRPLFDAILYQTDTERQLGYLKENVFPIIDTHLRVPSSEESVNELIKEIYKEACGRGNIPNEEYYTFKLWNAYRKYREDISKEDVNNG